jgi:hypothetical protein
MIFASTVLLRTLVFSSLLLGMFFTLPRVAHAQTIGGGYSCAGTQILNNKSKVVKLSVAKTAIQKKIDALGAGSKNKAKKTALKKIISNLTACSKGQFSEGGGDSGGGASADVAGFYAGKFVRSGAELPGGTCSLPESINASYKVTISGTKITVDPQSNQFHSNLEGVAQVGGFKAVDVSKSTFGKLTVTMTVTELTATSATITVEKNFVSKAPSKSCTVTVSGSFTRTI